MQTHQQVVSVVHANEQNRNEMKCHTKTMEQEINFDVFIFKVSQPMNYALLIAMKHFIFRVVFLLFFVFS